MNPTELRNPEYSDANSPELVADASQQKVEVEVGTPSPLVKLPASTSQTSEQWRQIGQQASLFLSRFGDYWADFYGAYKPLIWAIVLIIGTGITLKLALALLGAINDLPLLSPAFELIGIGYTVWFVYRYLWYKSNRDELLAEFNTLKQRVLGDKD